MSLCPGGAGGRPEQARQRHHLKWELEKVVPEQDLSDSDESSYSLSTSSDSDNEYDDDELLDCDELEDCCVSDMKGVRILPVDKIATAIRNDMCCKKCAISGHRKYMNDFISYTMKYEEEVQIELGKHLFGSRMDELEWRVEHHLTTAELYKKFCGGCRLSIEDRVVSNFSVAEETYGFATSLYGLCGKKKRSHVFRIDADKIGVEMRRKMHGNQRAETFSINYKLVAAMQQMGCGSTDIATLAGFLGIPSSWTSVARHMQPDDVEIGRASSG